MEQGHNNTEQRIEKVVERALAARGADPLAGFEGRLLARVAGAEAAPKGVAPRWTWLTLAAAAAVLAIALGLWLLRPEPHNAGPVVRQQPAPVPAVPSGTVPQAAGPQTAKKVVPTPHRQGRYVFAAASNPREMQRDSGPRLASFPAPAPLTAEEKQLLQLARNAAQRDSGLIAYMRLRTEEEIVAEEALNRADAEDTVPQDRQYAPLGPALKR